MKVYVEGKLKTRSWEKDGQIRRKTEVIAENIQILYRPDYLTKGERAEAASEEAQDALLNDTQETDNFNDIF